jgi:hypothetical protein
MRNVSLKFRHLKMFFSITFLFPICAPHVSLVHSSSWKWEAENGDFGVEERDLCPRLCALRTGAPPTRRPAAPLADLSVARWARPTAALPVNKHSTDYFTTVGIS